MTSTKKILIIAGEASGDLHGAKLVKELRCLHPQIYFYGMGGSQMEQAGVNLLVKTAKLSIIGFLEVIVKIKQFIAIFNKLRRSLVTEQPDLVILIDYPEFNLRFAKVAKRHGLKVVYYISPQLWAWRQKRVEIVKKNVDHMAVIFPFEVDFYQKANVSVSFVGHPLVETVKTTLDHEAACKLFDIAKEHPVVGLMPGSRFVELKFILPILAKAAHELSLTNPQIQFVLPLASAFTQQDIQPYLEGYNLTIKFVTSHHYDAMKLCDVIIVASGTATLEIALLEVPMVIVYRGSRLSYAIAKRMVKIPHVGLCNIVANRQIIQEFIQDNATSENITHEVRRILTDENYLTQMKSDLKAVNSALAESKHAGLSETISSLLC